jgi:hypothetical protein
MNHIRRIAILLAGLTATVLASASIASAMLVPPPGGTLGHPVKQGHITEVPTHTVVVGGMPGWQITLIAAGAAIAAAVLAVLLDRTLTARRRMTASA